MSAAWPNAARTYLDLRDQFFKRSLQELGLEKLAESQPVCGLSMDLSFPNGVATLVGLADGNASMYFGSGGGVIGGFAHEKVNKAARCLCAAAGNSLASFSLADDASLPAKPGWIKFYLRTKDGLLAADAAEPQLHSGHALTPLFLAAHEVISGLRELSKSQGDSNLAAPKPVNEEGMGRASVDLFNMILAALKQPNGEIHAETAVGIAAGVAGAFLLIRCHKDELEKVEAGTVVASIEVERARPGALRELVSFERRLGLKSEALEAIPPDNRPKLSPEEISARFISKAVAVCRKYGLTPEESSTAALHNAAKVIEAVKPALPPEISNAIAFHYLGSCSATAPALEAPSAG